MALKIQEFLTNEALQSRIETVIDDQQRKLQQLTLSGLAALNATIIKDAQNDNLLAFNGWNLLSTSGAGEAIASADAFLLATKRAHSTMEQVVISSFSTPSKRR